MVPDIAAEEDISWCYDVVQDVSRTFAITVSELEEPMAREICLGYLLCRVADTIEDAQHIPPATQASLLDSYGRALDPADAGSVEAFTRDAAEWRPDGDEADWRLVANTPRVVRCFRGSPAATRSTVRPAVRDLVAGMAMFVRRYAGVGGLRVRTTEELSEYCWYAAGTVGRLVTGLVARGESEASRNRLYASGWSFALLLQLVNVAKDVAVDYETENNVYLPQELLDRHGLEVTDIGDPARAGAFAPAIRDIVDRAEDNLDGAQAWLEAMPTDRGNSLSAWAIPFLLAVATLRELAARPEDVISTGGVKISRTEVAAVIGAVGDGVDLGSLRERVASRPFDTY